MMTFYNSFIKEWFSVMEMGQFLKTHYQINYTPKALLQRLNRSNLVEFYINLKGGTDDGDVRIGKKQSEVVKFDLKDPAPQAGYNGSLAQLQAVKEEKIYWDNDRIYIVLEKDEDGILFPCFFSGLFDIPSSVFNEINFLFSDEKTLYLPEQAIYSSFELLDNPAEENSKYQFNFLYIEFSHAKGQGAMNIEDIRIYLPSHIMGEFIDYFKTEATEETPEPEKTVKNKSDNDTEKPTTKREIITPIVLSSIKSTAEAYPHLGGYQIVNAVLEALQDQKGYRKTDFMTPEAYLRKAKAEYGLQFPRNSGRHKPEIIAILTA